MSIKSMAAAHSAGKGHSDVNFSAATEARTALVQFGKDNIVDATLGVVKNEEADFATLPTVEKCYRNMPGNELMDYAPISGLDDFLSGAVDFVFQGHQPKGTQTAAIATPGGTGAIHHVIYNYVDKGDKFLIPYLHWDPYTEMGIEMGDVAERYHMFGPDNQFSLEDLKEKAKEALKTQKNLLTIFNTPAHNPSGYTMSNEDWKEITDFFRDCAEDQSKRLIVLWDMAYTDYAGDKDEVRDFLKYFDDMPENMLLLVAFSMSKSFLIYGMRSGALICVSTVPEVVDEFKTMNAFSNRATWSNGSRGAQKLLAMTMADSQLKAAIDKEREYYKSLIEKRAQIFLEEAKEVELRILPYKAGFFITVPAKDTVGLSQKLIERKIYTIPLNDGLRFAISAVPTGKISGLAKAVKEVFAGHEPDPDAKF